MFKRLKTLIEQYSYSCNNKISILTDIKNDELLISVQKDYNAPILNLTNDFDPYCVIIIKYNNMNGILLKFIDDNIEKSKKIILIVDRDFDFSNLVTKTKANLVEGETLITSKIIKNGEDYGWYDLTYFNTISDIMNVFDDINFGFSKNKPCRIKGEKEGIKFEWILAPRAE